MHKPREPEVDKQQQEQFADDCGRLLGRSICCFCVCMKETWNDKIASLRLEVPLAKHTARLQMKFP